MLVTLTYQFLSLFFILIIATSFIIRSEETGYQTKTFGKLLICDVVCLVLEIVATFTLMYSDEIPILNQIVNRVYMFFLVLSLGYLSVFTVFLNKDELSVTKQGKIYRYMLDGVLVISAVLLLVLPSSCFETFSRGRYGVYLDGAAIYYVVAIACIYSVTELIMIFIYKDFFTKQRLYCWCLHVFFMLLIFLARVFFAGVTVVSGFIIQNSILLYFIFENYDIKRVAKLKELQAQANDLNAEKTDFLSNMSHNIRDSLNVIVVNSNDLIDNTQNEEVKNELHDVIYACDSLLEIVGNILDLNKIESDELELSYENYNIKSEVKSLATMASVRIEDKPINFVMNIDNAIPDCLKGDKVHVKQVVNNLLTNAFKYTNEGNVDFNLTCVNDFENRVCELTIDVKDTGIGIKDTSRLFNKFDRMDVDKVSTVEGTGLGLAITKKIIDLMGGTITVESEYGKGSRFVVVLKQEIIDASTLEVKEDVELDYNFGNRRILVIDDNKLNLDIFNKVLSPYHCSIDNCVSTDDAIEKLRNNGYDLIFTDIRMKGIDGHEVLRYAMKYDIPTVALTADAVQGARESYLSEGFTYYVAKPYNKKDIYDIFVKMFRK